MHEKVIGLNFKMVNVSATATGRRNYKRTWISAVQTVTSNKDYIKKVRLSGDDADVTEGFHAATDSGATASLQQNLNAEPESNENLNADNDYQSPIDFNLYDENSESCDSSSDSESETSPCTSPTLPNSALRRAW